MSDQHSVNIPNDEVPTTCFGEFRHIVRQIEDSMMLNVGIVVLICIAILAANVEVALEVYNITSPAFFWVGFSIIIVFCIERVMAGIAYGFSYYYSNGPLQIFDEIVVWTSLGLGIAQLCTDARWLKQAVVFTLFLRVFRLFRIINTTNQLTEKRSKLKIDALEAENLELKKELGRA
jgi:hypothetical protein